MGDMLNSARLLALKAGIVLVLLLVVAACGGDPESEAEPDSEETAGGGGATEEAEETEDAGATEEAGGGENPVVRLQALDGGMSALALKVIEQQGFDEANGFQGEFQYIPIDAAAQHFLQGESDVSFDVGPPDLALQRSEDYDVVSFTPLMGNHTEILVPADSEYQSIEDLQGATVGHFGDDSTATLSISLLLQRFHDLDFFTDYQLVLNSPPALVELLAAGEVEAIVTFEPHSSRAAATIEGGVRSIYDPGEDWAAQTDGTLWILTPAATREWIDANPEAAQGVETAACDAAEYINNNGEEIIADPAYDEILGLEEDAKQDLLEFFTTQPFDCEWDEDQVENAELFLDYLAEQGVLFEENPGGVVAPLDELIGG